MAAPSHRATSAGIGLLFGGAAVAVVQVLQQTVAAFNPQPIVTVLIGATAFFVGLASARVRTRHGVTTARRAREAQLRRIVGVWPAPRIERADGVRLGVFPARRALGREPEYVERDVDGALREALQPGAVLLLVGEPRAGASRTALEATRRALGGVAVLAPRSPEALRELLALDPPLDLPEEHVLVWLDALDRFSEVLDVEGLEALRRLAPTVTVVATIRSDDWDAWLAGTGASARAARAFADRARVFELHASLSAPELARAQPAHEQLDLSGGIAAAAAGTGRESLAPSVPHDREADGGVGEPPAPDPARRDPWLLSPAGAAALSLVALGIVLVVSGFSTPSAADRLANAERDAARDGWFVDEIPEGSADLHAPGSVSHLLLLRDRRGVRSDQIRIYDVHGQGLNEAFHFEPSGPRAIFQFRGATDVDFDGAAEIVGGYGYYASGRQAVAPLAIDWSRGARRYSVVALDLGKPTLHGASKMVQEHQYLDQVYAPTTTFRDPSTGASFSAHRVQDFALTSAPHRIVAGWFLRPWLTSADVARFEIRVAILDKVGETPHVTPCTFSGGRTPMTTRFRQDRLPWRALEERYNAISVGHKCMPSAAQ